MKEKGTSVSKHKTGRWKGHNFPSAKRGTNQQEELWQIQGKDRQTGGNLREGGLAILSRFQCSFTWQYCSFPGRSPQG